MRLGEMERDYLAGYMGHQILYMKECNYRVIFFQLQFVPNVDLMDTKEHNQNVKQEFT
jgi:hypothetical protein